MAARGAVGMLLINTPEFPDTPNLVHEIPTVHLNLDAGEKLLAFLAARSGETATITPSEAGRGKADVWTAAGGLGGPEQTLGVSKPDLTAPGVGIIAATTPDKHFDDAAPDQMFAALTGTSMASPHVAGAGALLKALKPDWTLGQIKSALMTTAKTRGILQPDGKTPATPFYTGSGRLDLAKAGEPSLAFDVPSDDFVTHKDDLWNVNYPSLYIPAMPATLTVQRTAHSEEPKDARWRLQVDAPSDLKITVPALLVIPAGGEATFDIAIDASAVPAGEVRHATLFLKGPGSPHLPITSVRDN